MALRIRPLLLIAVTVLALVLSACTVGKNASATVPAIPERTATPRNIILIGWDGAGRNHVKECLARSELPNLKKLASEGTLVAIDILRVTDTKAGWSQILTGYEPEVTGVYSNGRYQPIPEGYTVFERLEKHFGPDNIKTAAVIGKKGNVDADPPQRFRVNKKRPENEKKLEGEIMVENGVAYRVVPGKPFYNAKKHMDLFQNGLGENDKVGPRALQLLDEYKNDRFFLFVHFADVDHQGHKFGEDSKEYNDALISCDVWLGKIMQKLKELKLYDNTLIYVTADHGFDEGQKTHSDAPYVFLATNDRNIVRRGERGDIAPTILERFGVDLTSLEPSLNGHSLLRPYSAPLW